MFKNTYEAAKVLFYDRNSFGLGQLSDLLELNMKSTCRTDLEKKCT